MPIEYRDEGRNHRGGGMGGGRNSRDHRDNRARNGGERRGIPLSDLDPHITEASRKVIGCSIEVHKALGPGYDPSVYLGALRAEMDAMGLSYKVDHRIPVKYKDKMVGEVCATLFVDGLFLVHLMARPGPVSTAERMILRAQLKAADLDLGLIVNFAERRLKDGLVRVLNVEKINVAKGVVSDGVDDDFDTGERLADFDSQSP